MLFKIVESISKIFTKSISLESDTDSVEITVPEERTLLIDSNIVSGNLLKFNDLDIANNIYVGNNAYVSGTVTGSTALFTTITASVISASSYIGIPTSPISIGDTITGGTANSILFVNPAATIAQDNPSFIYEDASNHISLTSDAGMSFKASDLGDIINSYNTSAGSANQFFINHNLGNVELGNLRGNTIVTDGNLGINVNATQANFAKFITRSSADNLIALTENVGLSSIIAWDDTGASNTLRLAGNPLVMTGDGGGGAEHVRVTSAGDVGIGTIVPNFKLAVTGTLGVSGSTTLSTISGTTAQFTTITASNVLIYGTASLATNPTAAYLIYNSVLDKLVAYPGLIVSGNLTASIGQFTIVSGTTAQFTTITGSIVTGSTGLFTSITASTGINITNGNLIFGTAGKGVDFSINPSATSGTMSSELLSDYEEGTWSPTLSGSTTSGSFTYSLRSGIYTKIGNVVNINCYIVISSTATALTGSVRIGALPFLVRASSPAGAAAAVGYYGLNTTINSLSWTAQPSTSYINFWRNTAPGSSLQTALTGSAANELGNSPIIGLQGFYYTNE